MIKLIIFDLDGVLIESKDIHFKALNEALVDFEEQPITYEEHISIYDGLPTKKKLEIKKININKIKDINNRKQKYTRELLFKNINKNEKFITLFKRLKEEKYKICIASNSIRDTVKTIVDNLGISSYVDYIMSNEDVNNGKPNAEIYLKCMICCGVNPQETLIIEDSYIGRQGAYNSGALLCAVKNPEEVTYENIMKSNKNNKQKWKGNNMNILIPMAGEGSRFAKIGYTFPKPLIEIKGKPMIQVIVENLNIEGQYIFIVRTEHYEKYNLKYMLEMIAPECKIITVDSLTEGAACTTLLAKEYINNNEQLILANSDQWIKWDSSDFMYKMQGDYVDGGIVTFKNMHPKWSYAKEKNGYVIEVAEKKPISNDATVGIYFWKKGSDYIKYAEQMIQKNIRVNNEFYVAPVFNQAIIDNKKIKIYSIDTMCGLGTPEDLDNFIKMDINI